MRPAHHPQQGAAHPAFPFLFGGTFIEACLIWSTSYLAPGFPFLFGGTFIEALQSWGLALKRDGGFPFLFGGTFIEANVFSDTSGFRGTFSLPFRRDFH